MIDKYDAPEGCIAVEQENCKGCIFNKSGSSLTENCINNDTIHGCFSAVRKDGISVIFVEQETPDSSISSSIELYNGKYRVDHDGKGKLTVYRNGEEWSAKTNDLIGDGFVLALVQKIEDLQSDIEYLKNETTESNDGC